MVMDVASGRQLHIPSLKSSADSAPAECPCGIHSIALNPSSTLFATGAENTNDVAIYMLPTFDPVMVGEVSICTSNYMSSFQGELLWNHLFSWGPIFVDSFVGT